MLGFGQGVPAIGLLFICPLDLTTIRIAALIASLYRDALMVAPIFPGTAWADPEFEDATPRPLGLHPQQLIGYILLALLVLAAVLAFANR